MRPDWDDYFINISIAVSKRGDCTRRQVGCVLVDSKKHIKATGYNGTRAGQPGCLDGACPRGKLSKEELPPDSSYDTGPGACIASHAELNALLHLDGLPEGLVAYISEQPCPGCEKILRNAGLKAAHWPGGYLLWH